MGPLDSLIYLRLFLKNHAYTLVFLPKFPFPTDGISSCEYLPAIAQRQSGKAPSGGHR
jgi:hypothetical protein